MQQLYNNKMQGTSHFSNFNYQSLGPIYGRPVKINQSTQQRQFHIMPKSEPKRLSPILKVNLSALTIVSSILVSIMLISFLIIGCNNIENINCSVSNLPMISRILEYRYYDRIFIYVSTYFSFCVQLSNVRAFYCKFAPYFNPNMNTTLYYLGIIPSFIIPIVGIIDYKLHNLVHSTFAVIFFISYVSYIFFFISQLKQYGVQVLTPSQAKYVQFLNYIRWSLALLLLTGLLSTIFFGPHFLTPWCEWIVTLLLLIFFAIAAPINDYVECIASDGQVRN